jgi:hypothetical protein
MPEGMPLGVEDIDTFTPEPYPQPLLGILVQAGDIIAAQRLQITRHMPEYRKGITVVFIEPVVGAKPHKALLILQNGTDKPL